MSAEKADNVGLVKTAAKYVGIKESGQNSGYWVERFQASVQAPKGSPWCAAFVSFVLDEIGNTVVKIRSALSQRYITRNSVKAKHVAKGYKKIGPGWLAIWKLAGTYKGHIGIVVKWGENSGSTIEGNTGPDGGRDGDGVYLKSRKIIDYSQFKITNFTPTQ